MPSVFEALVEAVHDELVTLAPSGIATANIIATTWNRRKERLEAGAIPCIIVSPGSQGQTHAPTAGTNVHEQFTYPVLVTILGPARVDNDGDGQVGTQDATAATYDVFGWAEDIIRHLMHKRVSVASEGVCIVDCVPVMQQAFTPLDYVRRNVVLCGIMFQITTRENRTAWA